MTGPGLVEEPRQRDLFWPERATRAASRLMRKLWTLRVVIVDAYPIEFHSTRSGENIDADNLRDPIIGGLARVCQKTSMLLNNGSLGPKLKNTKNRMGKS